VKSSNACGSVAFGLVSEGGGEGWKGEACPLLGLNGSAACQPNDGFEVLCTGSASHRSRRRTTFEYLYLRSLCFRSIWRWKLSSRLDEQSFAPRLHHHEKVRREGSDKGRLIAIKQAEELQRCIDRAQPADDCRKKAIPRIGLELSAPQATEFDRGQNRKLQD
jgi:hypothetical protein